MDLYGVGSGSGQAPLEHPLVTDPDHLKYSDVSGMSSYFPPLAQVEGWGLRESYHLGTGLSPGSPTTPSHSTSEGVVAGDSDLGGLFGYAGPDHAALAYAGIDLSSSGGNANNTTNNNNNSVAAAAAVATAAAAQVAASSSNSGGGVKLGSTIELASTATMISSASSASPSRTGDAAASSSIAPMAATSGYASVEYHRQAQALSGAADLIGPVPTSSAGLPNSDVGVVGTGSVRRRAPPAIEVGIPAVDTDLKSAELLTGFKHATMGTGTGMGGGMGEAHQIPRIGGGVGLLDAATMAAASTLSRKRSAPATTAHARHPAPSSRKGSMEAYQRAPTSAVAAASATTTARTGSISISSSNSSSSSSSSSSSRMGTVVVGSGRGSRDGVSGNKEATYTAATPASSSMSRPESRPVVDLVPSDANARVLSLYLRSTDEMQCRFAVKNDEKQGNQRLQFVQQNGYLEYKARYCKKRGQQTGYGFFHVAFVARNRAIYPFQVAHYDGSGRGRGATGAGTVTNMTGSGFTSGISRGGDASGVASGGGGGGTSGGGSMDNGPGSNVAATGVAPSSAPYFVSVGSEATLTEARFQHKALQRVELTCRLYQSFRGVFPSRTMRFEGGEAYHPLFVDDWQDATLLRMPSDCPPGMTVEADHEGESVRYTVASGATLDQLCNDSGISFPCPIPAHPERLNDVGMLRMCLQLRLIWGASHDSPHTMMILPRSDEYEVWVRMKVVQQLSGKKRKFASMLRAEHPEWVLPPMPTISSIDSNPAIAVRHTLGRSSLQGHSAVRLMRALAKEICEQSHAAAAAAAEAGTKPTTTPLHLAASDGDLGTLMVLLQSDVTLVHSRDSLGHSPMHLAVRHNHLEAVRMLYNAGGLVTAANSRGHTPTDLARMLVAGPILSFLELQIDLEERGAVDIFRAAATGNTHLVRRALASQPCANGMSALGYCPLALAVINNHPLAAMALLQGGATAAVASRAGDTVVHTAAGRGFVYTLVLLLHHDPRLARVRTPEGSTPLHHAAAGGYGLCCRLLMSCGASTEDKDNLQRTAADVALAHGKAGTHVVLGAAASEAEAPDDVRGTLHDAVRAGDVAVVRSLLKQGYDVSQANTNGETPLQLAAEHGNPLVLDQLIATLERVKGTDAVAATLNRIGPDGRNAVHAACCRRRIGAVVFLLASSLVQLDLPTRDGDTPLHLAAAAGLPVTTAFLLICGAQRDIFNAHGRTAIEVAKAHGHDATARVLSASSQQLVAAKKIIYTEPGIPVGADARGSAPLPGVRAAGYFDWDAFVAVLQRIWYCTIAIRAPRSV